MHQEGEQASGCNAYRKIYKGQVEREMVKREKNGGKGEDELYWGDPRKKTQATLCG